MWAIQAGYGTASGHRSACTARWPGGTAPPCRSRYSHRYRVTIASRAHAARAVWQVIGANSPPHLIAEQTGRPGSVGAEDPMRSWRTQTKQQERAYVAPSRFPARYRSIPVRRPLDTLIDADYTRAIGSRVTPRHSPAPRPSSACGALRAG